MAFLITPFATALALAAAVSLVVMALAMHRHASQGGKTFVAMMGAVVWWTLFAALDAAAVEPALKIAFSMIEYAGTVSTAPLFLLFAMRWRVSDRRLPAAAVGMLWIVPAATIVIVSNRVPGGVGVGGRGRLDHARREPFEDRVDLLAHRVGLVGHEVHPLIRADVIDDAMGSPGARSDNSQVWRHQLE